MCPECLHTHAHSASAEYIWPGRNRNTDWNRRWQGRGGSRHVTQMYSSTTLRRMRVMRSDWVRTTIPASTGVVQEAGSPLRPSISTRHTRHEPKLSSESVAQSLGTLIPASSAARITLVSTAVSISRPSIVSRTRCSDIDAGVPRSFCGRQCCTASAIFASPRPLKDAWKPFNNTTYRHRC